MTNKEIKFELAKVALTTCRNMTSESLTESIKNLYEWVVEEPEVEEEPAEKNFDGIDIKEELENILPELKESEDEGIKEWLINLVKGHIKWLEDRIREQLSNGQVYGDELVKAKNSLAWLEKQGEKLVKDIESDKAEMFKAGAQWQKEHSWKPADGDDLPEIDREVIAILDNGKVVFAHRPPEFWDGKNIVTGEVTRHYPRKYDKGGWNIPNVKYWLDVELQNMED